MAKRTEFDEAQFHFDRATAHILAEHQARRREMMGMVGPKYDRERAALDARWKELTAPARELRERSEAEIAENGEISEETSFAWDAIMPRPALQLQAAE